MNVIQVFIAFTMGFHSSCFSVYANVLVEKTERFEINWTRQRIQFTGEAAPKSNSETFADVEKKAWDNGLLNIRDAIAEYHAAILKSEGVDDQTAKESGMVAGGRVASTTYSYKNEYLADGSVVVYLENSLPRAVFSDSLSFGDPNKVAASEGLNSNPAAVFKLPAGSTKVGFSSFTIEGPGGKVLFSRQHISKEAYKSRLMGRWLEKPAKGEIKAIAGVGFSSLELKPGRAPNVFIADEAEWGQFYEKNRIALVGAKIVVASM